MADSGGDGDGDTGAGGDGNGDFAETDAPRPGGPGRLELAATGVATLCALAFVSFATLEVLVLEPGLERLAAAVALVGSAAAALAGGVTLRSSLAGQSPLHVGTVRDGIAATLTGATVLLVVTPNTWTSFPFLSALGLSAVGVVLVASAVPIVRARLGLPRAE